MMTFVNISFNFSISPSRRFFSSNFVKDIRFAWGMVISFDERTRKKFSREADAEISQQYNFHPIELVSIRRICTVSSVHILSIRRWNVCMCVRVFLRRLFLGIPCFIKSSVACKYRLEIGGESWRSVETSSLNRVWTARELSASNIVDPSRSIV